MEVKVIGLIDRITYFNESNYFGIVRVKLDYRKDINLKVKDEIQSEYLNITCKFRRKPLLDEMYIFTGEFVTNQYGLQLKASNYEITGVDTLEGVVTYLSSDLFKGIGVKIATKVFETLGEDCLKKISEDKSLLDKVEGLTSKQKTIIYEGVVTNELNNRLTLELLNLGLSMSLALKLINELKENCLEIIKENPYKLISEVNGIGFIKADQIAMKLGVSKDSPLRLKELIIYVLTQMIYSLGNCYIEKDELFIKCNELIDNELSKEIFEKLIIELSSESRIFIDTENNVYEAFIYKCESIVANFVKEKLDNNYKFASSARIDSAISDVKRLSNIEYNDMQLKAIKTALKENISIITGGPGTGKSTVIKAIKDCYADILGNDVALEEFKLLAPTGRAAKRLNEVTLHPACTIHKFLGYEGHGVYKYGFNEKVLCKVVVIDESSMIDVMLCARLFSALEKNCKVIIVGDSDQLPSVGPGNVLYDLIDCGEIKTVKLTKIHRQAENSTIISLAHHINEGYLPNDLCEKKPDRNFIACYDNMTPSVIVKTIKQGLQSGMDLINDIQVLAPIYKGDLGINNLNKIIQENFNSKDSLGMPINEYIHNGICFRENDKVIQLVNRSEKKVMNGDIGQIVYIDYSDNKFNYLTVNFDIGDVNYSKEELDDLNLAYCMSIHKAQGSEFSLVIMPFSYKYFMMLRRKIIYTGVTRAKKYLIMIGNPESMKTGINNLDSNRKTRLKDKILNTYKNKIDDSLSAFDTIEESNSLSPYDFMD